MARIELWNSGGDRTVRALRADRDKPLPGVAIVQTAGAAQAVPEPVEFAEADA